MALAEGPLGLSDPPPFLGHGPARLPYSAVPRPRAVRGKRFVLRHSWGRGHRVQREALSRCPLQWPGGAGTVVAAATPARSVPLTARRSVQRGTARFQGWRSEVTFGRFRVLRAWFRVVERSARPLPKPQNVASLGGDAGGSRVFGWRPVSRVCSSFYYLMWSSHRPPGPGHLPRGWHRFYETAGEELGASLVPDHSFRSHFPFSPPGGIRPGARCGLVQTQTRRGRGPRGPEEAARQACRWPEPPRG